MIKPKIAKFLRNFILHLMTMYIESIDAYLYNRVLHFISKQKIPAKNL